MDIGLVHVFVWGLCIIGALGIFLLVASKHR